jgi:multidrug resistance efflux pump
MPSSFVHTLRSLERAERPWLWVSPALALALGWWLWMTEARVNVYAPALKARIEVRRMANRVAALESGRIVTLRCELGRFVERGEVLVELDSSLQRAELSHERAEIERLERTLRALRDQIGTEEAKRVARSKMDALAATQGDYALEAARLDVGHREELARIAQTLSEQRLTARIDAVNAGVELSASRLQLDRATVEAARLRAAQVYEEQAQLARVAELRREQAELEAEQLVHRASVERVQAQLDRRVLTAPASGRLGNIAALQVGDVVKAGDLLATVIPDDDVRVVAEFAPDDAVGRILPGQPARVRLNGFSWLEFGMLTGDVQHVASEPHDGTIRAEIAMHERLAGVPIQHGLPSSVDVRVGRDSPWSLLRRSIGAILLDAEDRAPPYYAEGPLR